MVEHLNKSGKRLLEEDEASQPPSKKHESDAGGLHKFAGRSSSSAEKLEPAEDIRRVARERFEELAGASFALRGAISFDDSFKERRSDGYYSGASDFYKDGFYKALPNALKTTSSLDTARQGLVVEMSCFTEKTADSGSAINMAFKHLDDFDAAPRSSLLLNGVHFFPIVKADARSELFGHLQNAIGKGYLGKAHLDALNACQQGQPSEIGVPLSLLARKLEPIFPVKPNKDKTSALAENQPPKLEELSPEILQNILLRAIEPDLRKDRLKGLEEVLKTTDAIASTSKGLRKNADELKLLALSGDSKEALSKASDRYGTFLMTSEKLLAMEQDENFTPDDPHYLRALRKAAIASKKVIAMIKLLGTEDQSEMISRFCQFEQIEDVAYLMVAASERADDFDPKPRSEMFANVIQLLPQVSANPEWQHIAHDRLARAELAGQLEQTHYNALKIADLVVPGLTQNIAERVASFRQAATSSLSAMIEPERPALLPADSFGDRLVTKVVQARQSLLQKVDDRAFSR